MNDKEPIKRADSLYASCKTCGEVASWVPYKSGGEWECQACRTGTRQFGRADREEFLRSKIGFAERREKAVRILVKILPFVIAAWILSIIVAGIFRSVPVH